MLFNSICDFHLDFEARKDVFLKVDPAKTDIRKYIRSLRFKVVELDLGLMNIYNTQK